MDLIAEVQAALRRQFGAELSKVERWSVFRKGESTQEWLNFLGQTAVVLTHQELMVEISGKLLANDPTISTKERLLIQLAFAIHDIGEITVGDTPAPHKTFHSNSQEFAAALASLNKLDVDLADEYQLEKVYQAIVMGDNAILHSLFCAIEQTEYLMTAVEAYAYLINNNDASINKWQLVARVLSFDLPKVIELTKLYPHSIGRYLSSQQETITQMLESVQSYISSDTQLAYQHSCASWQSYLSANI